MDNNIPITAKLGWFTSKIKMDVSYEGDSTVVSKIQCYEEGSIKACIAKLFKWVNEDCVTTVGGRKIYIDKDKFDQWKVLNVVQDNEQVPLQTFNDWVMACKMQNVNRLSDERFQELLNQGQLSQEACNKIGIGLLLSDVTLDLVPSEQIEKLFRGNDFWIGRNYDLERLLEMGRISETLYPIVKVKLLRGNEFDWEAVSFEQIAIFCRDEDFLNAKLKNLVEAGKISAELYPNVKNKLIEMNNEINWEAVSFEQMAIFCEDEDFLNAKLKNLVEIGKISTELYPNVKNKLIEMNNEINWENVSPEQIAIFCEDGDFLNGISPRVLRILLNNQKLENKDLDLIQDPQFQLIDFSALKYSQVVSEVVRNLLFKSTIKNNARQTHLQEGRLHLISSDQIDAVCHHFIDFYDLSVDIEFSEIVRKMKKSVLQSIDLSTIIQKQINQLLQYRFKDFTLAQVQYCVENKLLNLDEIKHLEINLLQGIDFTNGCSSSFHIRIQDLKISQLNDLLIHSRCRMKCDDRYLQQISGDVIKQLSPQAIKSQSDAWASNQIGFFNKEQVAYLMKYQRITWEMLPHLQPEVLKEVDRKALQRWLNNRLSIYNLFHLSEYEKKNLNKFNIELLSEKQREAVNSLDLNN